MYPSHQKAIEFVTKKQAVFYTLPPDVLPNTNGETIIQDSRKPETLSLMPSNIKFIDEEEDVKISNNKILYDLSKENNVS